ncbi:hypothetical protein H8356DRAFT_1385265 [Neocallimastix lanati (nom. inval.)]|nr:hypothetical protein H8356DRAFT_1385265 [Neocallimastix sp. JGI-2020a]
MKIDNYKFKEFKSYVKNKEISTVKILNKNEIKSRKKNIKDNTLLFNYNFPKNICTSNEDNKFFKMFLKGFNENIELLSDSKLFLLKEYENEIQKKKYLENKDSIQFSTSGIVEGNIDFSKFLIRMIENDELSDKEISDNNKVNRF